MTAWAKNAFKNLIPLSVEKMNLIQALKEWSFTGNTMDHEKAEELCELCEMEGLRYHFEIANQIKNSLWVGSKCIERFDIEVLDDDGTEISKKHKEAYLKRKIKDAHINAVIDVIQHCQPVGNLKGYAKAELDNYAISKLIKGNINAKVLNYLFLRFDEEGVSYNKRFFSIDIKTKINKSLLISLSENQFNRIRNALSKTQAKFYTDNK